MSSSVHFSKAIVEHRKFGNFLILVSEIVEEQRCHNSKIRLTCRDLDAHIAVLEAWYTSIQDYQVNSNVTRTEEVNIKTENDTELDKVYVYASPMHNGVYELVNNTASANITDFENTSVSDVTNEVYGLNDTVEVLMEFFNASEMCSVLTYSRRYSTLDVSEKRRDPIVKGSAVNLQAPLGNR
ncbi:hypothetical protein RR48_09787 [Papilio machaon]|uniref:Uncharacterized protein n=1 Tax=Papilio machaon TaxID=76193 RepID=A0A194R3N4_PAPMA|nr:hypothetical protein RR48_09787 [Papilio machaon]